MPRFFFDLYFERYVVLDSGEMAKRLLISRADLRECGGCIRVRDERRRETYRSSIAATGQGGASLMPERHDMPMLPFDKSGADN
jgi:hypothetical protein